MEEENYITMIDRRIKKLSETMPEATLEKQYIEVLLIDALVETFPCENPIPAGTSGK
jgi:hypothetical protein